jgi:hypothetical protein
MNMIKQQKSLKKLHACGMKTEEPSKDYENPGARL